MEIKFIKGNKVALGAFRKTVRKLRVAAYCRVSTDSEDQIKSYNSMIKYYTDLIEKNDEWEFVGIYADKAITGTNVKKRNEINRRLYKWRNRYDYNEKYTKICKKYIRHIEICQNVKRNERGSLF